jgi:hypothetical protein
MATTTLGVKLDDPTRERLKAAAQSIDRTPHWLIKQAIFNYLEKLEGGATLTELNGHARTPAKSRPTMPTNASWSSPRASCRSRYFARRSLRLTAAQSRKSSRCCWSRLA